MLAVICLAAGIADYFLFRPRIVLFGWLNGAQPSVALSNRSLQSFFSNYFPDICWCLALCITVTALYRRNYLQLPTSMFILVLPFLLETGQYLKLVPGTFDWLDILIYATIVLITVVLLFKTIAYEKDE